MTIETRRDEIECWPTRQDCIEQNRRALAAMLKHHGHIPPERDCSAEALAIRAQLGRWSPRSRRALAVRPDAGRSPAMAEDLAALLAEICGRYQVSERQIREHGGSTNARLARQALFHAAYHQLGMTKAAIGGAFDRSAQSVGQTIRFVETGSSR
ncbi:hypothetical protein OSH08_05610 [Kaistia geumhonensis]|uniref:Uncharacterized protein n=1 Tax=Kaistia geumhonensis TaxID=410839 RepID=A0ABU0M5S2_9HYPH|nr:hypothetical protein [Kaistia geumhonensis]MCX5478470.1 hypothetical protein [Kaistia geumhonensis]MDQ0516312.1 hypothetical protein [Kaistia geumhonensis]